VKVAFLLVLALTVFLNGFADEVAEQLHHEILLSATADAPAGATGKARLQAENHHGTLRAGIEIEVRGLPPGHYRISVTRLSDDRRFELGAIEVGDASRTQAQDEAEIEFGSQRGLPLPEGLDSLDVAGVFITLGERVLLAGDFMSEADTVRALFKARIPVAAGIAAPRAAGIAVIRARTRNGFTTGRFKLNVKGITPNATLALKVNGADAGLVTTDDHGRLRLGSLPEGIEADSITLLELAEPDGTNALTINF
jgi:hypothetical protein